MAQISNNDASLKADSVVSNNSSNKNTRTGTHETSWEFFKRIFGNLTDHVPKMINLASTMFTPNLSMPTKAMFSNILIGIDVLIQVKAKVTKIMDIINGESSIAESRKRYVKTRITQACLRKEGD